MINCAIIGCGVIGEVHAYAVTETERLRLRTVCDVIPSRARLLADRHGAAHALGYRSVLDDTDVDARLYVVAKERSHGSLPDHRPVAPESTPGGRDISFAHDCRNFSSASA